MTQPLFRSAPSSIARVALPVPVDSLFDYAVPPELSSAAVPGCRVLVPFSGRSLTGVIVARSDATRREEHTDDFAGSTSLARIERVVDPEPVLSLDLLQLLRDAAEEVLCPVGLALTAALPAGSAPRVVSEIELLPRGREALHSGAVRGAARDLLARLERGPARTAILTRSIPGAERIVSSLMADGLVRRRSGLRAPSARMTRERVARVVDAAKAEAICQGDLARAPRQAELLRELAARGVTPTRRFNETNPGRAATLRALVARGLVEVFERVVPGAMLGPEMARDAQPELTAEQAAALDPIVASIRASRHHSFLLHGVTGSGKTEVYLRAVAESLAAGRQALVLVPEITLTHQIVARLRARFGDALAILHSGLRPGERLEQWQRLRAGDTPIAVGARSALFAPLDRLGVIVIDEEHDSAYKNEEGFRYHARGLAERRARQAGCPLVLGSATPSLETRYRAERGEIERLVLERRIGGRPLPAVEIVDLAAERRRAPRGRKLILTRPLQRAVRDSLAAGGQVILFLNRRGFSTQILCFDCGHVERCSACDVALVYHAAENCLRCHYCDHRQAPPGACPGCGNPDTALLGVGTQRLEEEVRSRFPEARIARMDRDTARRRGHVESVLDGLRAGEIDILIGTQMVAKGHDFPGVSLVGVVVADLGLHMPDFRAAERTFQLLTQVAGRAGRAATPGRVIVQTYVPEHYAIRPVRRHDYELFYREELAHRATLAYPPFGGLTQVQVSGRCEEETRKAAEALATLARADSGSVPCEVLGPAPAPIARLRGRYRFQILVKGTDAPELRRVSEKLARASARPGRDITALVDVNPVHML